MLSQSSTTSTADLPGILDRIRARETDGVAELRSLLDLNPDSTEVMGPLAWALAQRGDHEEAVGLYRRYLELEPENTELRWRLADRLVNLGRIAEAKAAYEDALASQPDSLDAKMGLRYVAHLERKGGHPETFRAAEVPEPTPRQRENLELNNREFKEGRTRLESLPSRMYLESTLKCNFYCKTCSKGYEKYYAEDLRDSIFERVRNEAMPANVRISITGFGEPTMSKEFDKILSMAIENGSQVHFVTNASLLNFERLEKLTRFPVDITISCDGATKATFESIRAGSNFDLFLEKLAMIKKLRDIHLSHISSCFNFNFVCLRANIHELPDVIRLAACHGIRSVSATDYAFNRNDFDQQSLRFDPSLANRWIPEAVAVARAEGIGFVFPPEYLAEGGATETRGAAVRIFSDPARFPGKCSSPWNEPYVHTDGRVSPCCASVQFLGDLKSQSFGEVWNGWRYRVLRWRIHSPLPPRGCRECYLPWGINGGNAGNAIAREGLIVKGLYFLEYRLRAVARYLRDRYRAMRRPASAAPAIEPNFYMGKPIPKSAPPTQPATTT